ncbi:hypothetical protein TrCOL_g8799 [Triparma columacea]|uniref:THH1/TOM1/TOM3 domain-containing protein n=1 Tax=Triparma columacea TaxID=722753 RepID=A0A9W7GPZ2_9STRA|nr:hypothetical protein TrCOL_g8799 [Triparma columacea]
MSMLFRSIWMFSKASETDGMIGYKILSRLSTLLQLTSVSFLVYRWFKSTFVPGVGSSGRMVFRFFVVLNAVFYIAILATTRSDNEAHKRADMVYRVNSTLLTFCFVVISIATIVYGNRLKKIIKGTQNEEIISVALPKIAAVSWSLFVCFFLRAICYTYTPVTGQYETPSDGLDSVMYPILFYQLPEIVPAIVVGWSMLSDKNDNGLKQRWLRLWRNGPCGKKQGDEMDIVIDDEIANIRTTEVIAA